MHTFLLVLKMMCTFYPRRDCAVEKINIRSFMERVKQGSGAQITIGKCLKTLNR